MNMLQFMARPRCSRYGLKGPQAEQWLRQQGIEPPAAANSWATATRGPAGKSLLVARLGTGEFFVEDENDTAHRQPSLSALPRGVYPVLRDDAAFLLRGDGTFDVLAQVCNVNFAAMALGANTVIMTVMVGVSVLAIPAGTGAAPSYRIWCDPTFGTYLESTLAQVVIECGGSHMGATQ